MTKTKKIATASFDDNGEAKVSHIPFDPNGEGGGFVDLLRTAFANVAEQQAVESQTQQQAQQQAEPSFDYWQDEEEQEPVFCKREFASNLGIIEDINVDLVLEKYNSLDDNKFHAWCYSTYGGQTSYFISEAEMSAYLQSWDVENRIRNATRRLREASEELAYYEAFLAEHFR